ncbi:ADH6_1 [Sanghuangporus sanghuang]
MSDQKTFKKYAGADPKNWTQFEVIEYPSKKFEETDVEIAISHCGVCASDIHTISSGWGPVETPQVVGHEIAGVAVHVGSKVKGIKIGDRVGVGAQIGSCYDCKLCSSDNEQYCAKSINTYADRYPNGVRTQGGYSTGIIANEQFVFPIPAGLTNAEACSMMCGGLTVFSPIVRNGAGPGKRVGVIGIGRLGHYAIMKRTSRRWGADHIVVTEAGFQEQLQRGLDLIVSTVNVSEGIKLSEYLSMLEMHGKFICVGAPDEPIQSVSPFSLIFNGCFFGGSKIGSKKEATMMLELAARKSIKPSIEELPMKDVSKAVKGVVENKVRYVLKQDLA